MKLSRKFVSDYINIPDLTIKQIAEDMTSVGNEFDSASKIIDVNNLVVGEVIVSNMHPDSDKLRVNKVNVGNEVLDIVCGAPNCREGLKVIVAKVGAVLSGITIKSSTIRGEISNGMLCSISELGIESKYLKPEDSEGIHELPLDAIVGSDPLNYLDYNDEVIDFELTSNRGDLLSIIGMAYELGAIYNEKVSLPKISYKEIDKSIKESLSLSVNTLDCPLFLAKKVINVEIKESPKFIKERLIASGIRPINNVVDISNYVMIETGQPLHFYDADSLGENIEVRNGYEDEILVTLDNVERTLSSEDIVITNGKNTIGLAGVMGGLSTEVECKTKNIVIEAAIFDGIKIRKTSKRTLRSEASNRFEKGIDSKRTYMAINRACSLLETYASGDVLNSMLEHNTLNVTEEVIKVPYKKVEKVLGLSLSNDEIVNIIKSLNFDIITNEDYFTVTIPTRRPDIKIVEDVIEEIGRIYGIDNIVGKLPILTAKVGKHNSIKREIRNKMLSMGLNETLSYTLISEKTVKKYTTDDFNYVKIADPMSEERNTLRYSLINSLTEIFMYNKARSLKDISIFEIGKSFFKEETYKEELRLSALMSGDYLLSISNEKVDFYIIKGIVEELLDYLGYAGRYSFVVDSNIPMELHPKQSASIILQGKNIGVIGKIHPKELKDDVYVFEINLDKLLINKASKMVFKEISKYPSISKDLAFIMDNNITCGEIVSQIKKSGGKLLTDISVFDVYVGDNLNVNEKSIAYSLKFSDKDKTLTEEEVMLVFNKIIEEVTKKCNVVLRNK